MQQQAELNKKAANETKQRHASKRARAKIEYPSLHKSPINTPFNTQ
jgi:hypothetical protein